MSPKGSRHEAFKIALNRRWRRAAPDDCEAAQETTSRLSVDTYVEPDFVIFKRTGGLKEFSGPSALLVVEIAGSSLNYDKVRKSKLYATFGIREFWVIDAVRRLTHVFVEPSEQGYRGISKFSAAKLVVPRFAPEVFALRLDDLEAL